MTTHHIRFVAPYPRNSMPWVRLRRALHGQGDTVERLVVNRPAGVDNCEVCSAYGGGLSDTEAAHVRAVLYAHEIATEGDATVKYQIQTRPENSNDASAWTADGIGDQNEFTTEAEADVAIAELKKLGADWASAQYRVAPIR